MRILREDAAAVIIDVQENLVPVIHDSETVVKRLKKLVEGLEILEIPLIVSQQYTKGLGETIEPLKKEFYQFSFYEKQSFSCLDDHTIEKRIKDIHKKNVIVAGIESHVCVLQTAIDLKAKGFNPVVVADAIGSRKPMDKEIALKRMQEEGILLTTVESILFELCRFSENIKFKALSKVIK